MNLGHSTLNTKLNPTVVLEDLQTTPGSHYVDVVSGQASWQLYCERGRLVFASYSVEFVLARIQHFLRLFDFGAAVAAIASDTQIRSRLELETLSGGIEACDRVFAYLLQRRVLDDRQATRVVEALTREALESLMCLKEGTYTNHSRQLALKARCNLSIDAAIADTKKALNEWRAFAPVVWSPYQRPRLRDTQADRVAGSAAASYQLSPQMRKQLEPLLKGYTIRQLAILLKQEELKIARFLYPHILNGSIQLDDPPVPYDRLPKIEVEVDSPPPSASTKASARSSRATTTPPAAAPPQDAAVVSAVKPFKIACVDDSPTILKQIDRFLNGAGDRFAITPITDSVQALVQIIRLKPDLILMDVGMPNINGYDLCRLLRNNRLFAETPIVMVTGNTATVDRMKAKIVGATDFLSKPFTQDQLVEMVTKHQPQS